MPHPNPTRRAAIAALPTLVAILAAQLLGGQVAIAEGAPAATKSAKKKWKPKLKLVSNARLFSQPNESPRAVVLCPGKLTPYGGAQFANPAPAPDGEGVYPHSYERLGVQRGFHSTPVLFDPSPGQGARLYTVILQVKCGKKPGKQASPHDIALNIPSGRTVTLVATCPKKSVLIGGGFQRAAFENDGGVYPSESRAISKKKWRATGTAFGKIRNDFVSIGYCMASPKRKPLIKEVSATTAIAPRTVGFVTTPPCPRSRKMVWNGFDLNPKTGGPAQTSMLFADGIFNGNQSFTASAWNGTGVVGTLTAYGYCMKKKVIGGSLNKFTKKVGPFKKKRIGPGKDQDGNPNG